MYLYVCVGAFFLCPSISKRESQPRFLRSLLHPVRVAPRLRQVRVLEQPDADGGRVRHADVHHVPRQLRRHLPVAGVHGSRGHGEGKEEGRRGCGLEGFK